MTNLAQLHDCHSCYDERSIDQKKKSWKLISSELATLHLVFADRRATAPDNDLC